MKYLNRIKGFNLLRDYCIRLTFADDYSAELDLRPLFANPRGPLTEPFRDMNFFRRVFLDEGTLAWPNGYDISTDVLRYYCEQGRVTSDQEMHAYFAEEPAPSVLRDQPRPK
jgi:hypothetical protein